VVIEDFFTNGRDFVYYIIGRYNLEAFTKGTFGMQTYNGPLNAAIITTDTFNVIAPDMWNDPEEYKVRTYHSQMEKVKWKYLYETARLAWSKMIIHPRKVTQIRARQDRTLWELKKTASERAAAN